MTSLQHYIKVHRRSARLAMWAGGVIILVAAVLTFIPGAGSSVVTRPYVETENRVMKEKVLMLAFVPATTPLEQALIQKTGSYMDLYRRQLSGFRHVIEGVMVNVTVMSGLVLYLIGFNRVVELRRLEEIVGKADIGAGI